MTRVDLNPFARALAALMKRTPGLHNASAIERASRAGGRDGVSRNTVQREIKGTGNMTREHQEVVAACWRMSVEELLRHDPLRKPNAPITNGLHVVREDVKNFARFDEVFQVDTASRAICRVPIVQWKLLPLINNTDQFREAIVKEGAREVLTSDVGPGVVAAYMPDDSMESPSGRTIQAGTLLLIDSLRSPAVGDYVAVIMDDRQCYLRRLISDAGRRRLMPLNPRYQPIDAPEDRGAYVGVLIKTVHQESWP